MSLKNYPAIKTPPISFTLTTLGSFVPKICHQIYELGQAPLQILFGSFEVVPSYFDVGASRVEAFIYIGTSLPERIDLNCGCMIKVGDLDWVQFNSSNNTLIVNTSDNSLIGKHTIVLVQSFEKFKDVHPHTSFDLTV